MKSSYYYQYQSLQKLSQSHTTPHTKNTNLQYSSPGAGYSSMWWNLRSATWIDGGSHCCRYWWIIILAARLFIFLAPQLGCGYRTVRIGGCWLVFGEEGSPGVWIVLVRAARVRVLVGAALVSCYLVYYSIFKLL